MKRVVALLPVLLALQVGVQPALAWTWPADGPVLRPFVLGDDPYAAGQHRGVDIGAPSGSPVRAAAAGVVSFAGTVPGGGRTVTVQTADGYSVTLVHLGTFAVARGATVGEGDVVGTVGPSGDVELTEPYVHLGVRRTAEANGYVDPLGLLPPRAAPEQPPEPVEPGDEPAEPGGRTDVREPGGETPTPDVPRDPAAAVVGKQIPSTSVQTADRRTRHAPSVSTRREPLESAVQAPPTRAAKPAVAVHARPPGMRPPGGSVDVRRPGRFEALARRLEPAVSVPAASMPAGASVAGDAARPARAARSFPRLLAAALSAGLACAAAGLAVLRRELRDAAPTDRPAPVLLDPARLAAEDADGPRPAEEDRLVLDGDLERVLLTEAEPLPDLDRDHDSPEFVDVADDPRGRHVSCPQRRPHRIPDARSHRSRARLARR